MAVDRHLRFDTGRDGIATVTLNMADSTVNLLCEELVDELLATLQRLHAMKEVSGLIIRSAKRHHFLAGAPPSEMLEMEDAPKAMEKYQRGQNLMELIESLRFPSVAVIDGPCIGGGLELALCCKYRIAGEGSWVAFALPDVNFGLIPGLGGTQRLPDAVGLFAALELILSGRKLTTKEAFQMGLVDDYTASEILEDLARGWLVENPPLTRPARLPWWKKAVERTPYARKFLLRRIRREKANETGGAYPAPLVAVDLMEETFRSKNPFRFELEAKKAGELVTTPVAKSLIRLSLAMDQIRDTKLSVSAHKVEKIGVIGAGSMGMAIAHSFAAAGKSVRLRDVSTVSISRGFRKFHGWNQLEIDRNQIDRREAAERYRRIAPTTDWTGFRHADFVVERVIENAAVKKAVLTEIASHVSPQTVIATTTSTLSIVDLSVAVPHPERFLGFHFFHPTGEVPLVEIVPIATTSDEALSTALDLAAELGKTPVLVADHPGFLVNRVLAMYFNEALRAAEEGVPVAEIEAAMTTFGFAKGPLEMMDELGLDFVEELFTSLNRSLDHFPQASALVGALRTQGRLGKKNGRGFHFYSHGRKKLDEPFFRDVLKSRITDKTPGAAEARYVELVDRLVLGMVNEAAKCLEERVVFSVQDLNLAMVLGGGFPRFRGGLLAYANARNLRQVFDTLSGLAEKHGEHFRPTKYLSELAQIEGQFG